jgi:hypothetical protein
MAWFRRNAHPEEQLAAYVDGELNPRARLAVEDHVAACESCATLLAELQETKAMVSALSSKTLKRSLTLGPEHAPAPKPYARRSSFTFAPVAALTVLVALLFVDAAGLPNGSSEDGAATLADSPARQAESSEKDAAGGAGANQTFEAPTAAGTPPDTRSEALQPAAGAANPTPSPATLDRPGDDATDTSSEGDDFFRPGETSAPKDSGGGISTLRLLQILAAAAFVASLGAIYLPRFLQRER